METPTTTLEKVASALHGAQTGPTPNEQAAPLKVVFTLDEVKSLNAFQRAGVRHPFTCCWNNRDANHLDGEGVLVATERGWICPYCDYTQDWAHEWMRNWRWKTMSGFSLNAKPRESDWNETAVSIAIAAASNCLQVFEKEYPEDDRPRNALNAAGKWLKEPTIENRREAEMFENHVWRANRTKWTGRAGSAAEACGCAVRALRHPYSSAAFAIGCERFANGHEWDYVSEWLRELIGRLEVYRQG